MKPSDDDPVNKMIKNLISAQSSADRNVVFVTSIGWNIDEKNQVVNLGLKSLNKSYDFAVPFNMFFRDFMPKFIRTMKQQKIRSDEINKEVKNEQKE